MRIGIVGSGGMARRRGLAFAALDGCTVPAVAARNPETGSGSVTGQRLDLLLEPGTQFGEPEGTGLEPPHEEGVSFIVVALYEIAVHAQEGVGCEKRQCAYCRLGMDGCWPSSP